MFIALLNIKLNKTFYFKSVINFRKYRMNQQQNKRKEVQQDQVYGENQHDSVNFTKFFSHFNMSVRGYLFWKVDRHHCNRSIKNRVLVTWKFNLIFNKKEKTDEIFYIFIYKFNGRLYDCNRCNGN